MANIEVIGNGRCINCSGTTEIRRIESFPFPDDTQIREVEVCLAGCKSAREISFLSTNATTSFFHSAEPK